MGIEPTFQTRRFRAKQHKTHCRQSRQPISTECLSLPAHKFQYASRLPTTTVPLVMGLHSFPNQGALNQTRRIISSRVALCAFLAASRLLMCTVSLWWPRARKTNGHRPTEPRLREDMTFLVGIVFLRCFHSGTFHSTPPPLRQSLINTRGRGVFFAAAPAPAPSFFRFRFAKDLSRAGMEDGAPVENSFETFRYFSTET